MAIFVVIFLVKRIHDTFSSVKHVYVKMYVGGIFSKKLRKAAKQFVQIYAPTTYARKISTLKTTE